MVYDNCKIYGPYTRKDKRQHIVVAYPDGVKKTVSYPKYLIEKHIGKYLDKDSTVHHIDGNYENNHISNLQILPRTEHARLDAKRKERQKFVCPICKNTFYMYGSKLHDAIQNRKKGKSGPFCSRSCAGKYGKYIQIGGKKLSVVKITPYYTTHKRSLHKETYGVDTANSGKP